MKLPTSPFTVTDWNKRPGELSSGGGGTANWRSLDLGDDIHAHMIEYSPGYRSDRWCDHGHVLFVADGELEIDLRDGRRFTLARGQGFHVSDFGDTAHRVASPKGATVFVVD